MADRVEQLEALVRHLSGALKSLSLYPPTHPAFGRFVDRVHGALSPLLAEAPKVEIGLADETLVLEGGPWLGSAEQVRTLVERLKDRDVGTIAFHRGVEVQDIRALLEVLGGDGAAVEAHGGPEKALQAKGAKQITIAGAQQTTEEVGEETAGEFDNAQCRKVYHEAVASAKKLMMDARLGKIPSLAEARRTVEGLVEGVVKNKYALLALTMVKSYDEYLFNHSVNVGVLSIAMGQSLGLDDETLRDLGLGAFLHDLGKIYWPDELFHKPRDLTEEEWRLVKNHPVDGARTVEKMGEQSPVTLGAVLEHHVRFDQTGYPSLEGGREVSFSGLIVGIADAYDAMTTVRAYQNAWEPSKAIARMRQLTGKVFDPGLMESFVKLMGIYPVGTLVRLTTGELAIVVKPGNPDSSRPLVRILFDRTGRKVTQEEGVDINERDAAGRFKRSILMAVDPASKNIDVSKYVTPSPPAS